MALAKPSLVMTGGKELARLLKTLPDDKSVRAVFRSAVTASGQVLLKVTRAKAKKFQRSGALVRSLIKVVRTGKDKKSIYVVIGAQRRYEETYKGKTVIPPLYIHLVERGFISPDGSFTPGTNFLSDAAYESEDRAAKVFENKLGPAFEKVVANLAKKQKGKR